MSTSRPPSVPVSLLRHGGSIASQDDGGDGGPLGCACVQRRRERARGPARRRGSGGIDVTDRSLTVLYPALNEEHGIERAVRAAWDCGDRLCSDGRLDRFHVVVVDDGSTDGTPEVLSRLCSMRPELAVVQHEVNRGLGAAIRSGLEAVDTDLVFYTDSDLPVELTAVDEALALMDSHGELDAVSLYRLDRGGEGPRRYVYSFVYNALVRVVLGTRVRDVNFAAKLIRTEALDGVRLLSDGSFIDAELMARLQRRGHRIGQLPAVYHPRSRGVSTLSSFRVIRTILREMVDLTPGIRRERRARTT